MTASKELLECAKLVERLTQYAMHTHDDPPTIPGETDRDKTANILSEIEWSMGNGQCFFCYGHKPRAGWWTEHIGHEKDCGLAKLLEGLGRKITWIRENRSKSRFRMDEWSKKVGQELYEQAKATDRPSAGGSPAA